MTLSANYASLFQIVDALNAESDTLIYRLEEKTDTNFEIVAYRRQDGVRIGKL